MIAYRLRYKEEANPYGENISEWFGTKKEVIMRKARLVSDFIDLGHEVDEDFDLIYTKEHVPTHSKSHMLNWLNRREV